MLSIRLPEDVEDRLEKLADMTGRTKTYYAREALIAYIEELEDMYLAMSRLEKPQGFLSQEEAEKELGLDD